MNKLISVIAIALLQSACASSVQQASGTPMISFEQIGSEITVSHVALTVDADSGTRIAAN